MTTGFIYVRLPLPNHACVPDGMTLVEHKRACRAERRRYRRAVRNGRPYPPHEQGVVTVQVGTVEWAPWPIIPIRFDQPASVSPESPSNATEPVASSPPGADGTNS